MTAPDLARVCTGCQGAAGTHAAGCVLGDIERELQALAAACGLFVADVRERLDVLERLILADDE